MENVFQTAPSVPGVQPPHQSIPAASDTDQLYSDLQRTLFDFAQFKLQVCSNYANDAKAKLAEGNGPAARQCFRKAETAFESVQRCVVRLEYEDSRTEMEAKANAVGVELDVLWAKLITGGFPVL